MPNSEIEAAVRTKIGHDLHDGPLQLVVGAKMLAEAYAVKLERGDALAPQDLTRLSDLLARAVTDTRAIILDARLHPEALSAWQDALKDWLALQPIGKTKVDLQFDDDWETLPQQLGEAFFQMCREAIQNALRHARASRIQVIGRRDADQLQVDIIDDGNGFDPEKLPAGHFGVRGLRERAIGLGGDCIIRSGAHGTQVRIVLPDIAR